MKMLKYFVMVCAILAVTTAFPFVDKAQEQNHRGHRRVRRQEVKINQNTKYGLKDGVPYVNHQVNLANSADHKLDANAYASKDFHHNGPLETWGSLNYAHKPSGTGVIISGSNVPGVGTSVNAAGVWNVYKNGGFGIDLQGGYKQQFGGPGGSGPPILGVEIKGGYAFPKRG